MQPIQDKDFDQLFSKAFEEAEIMPSRNLWSGIESKLEEKKTRKLPVYWLAAAAILIIVSAGILIYNQQTAEPKQYAVVTKEKVKPTQPLKAQDAEAKVEQGSEEIISQLPVAQKIDTKLVKAQVKTMPVEANEKIVSAPEAVKQEVTIAKVEAPQKDLKQKIEEAIQPKEETVIASNATSVKTDVVVNENDQAEDKGIRNVGDLVNLVVNKMDKRKDKIIQFRTDDDDSSIASINIGPFKIGKRNKNK